MFDILPSWPLFVAFLAASFVLAATPGPGVVYIVTRTLAQGRRAGIASVAGVALGNLGNATGAALGLGALFAVSSSAFLLVKYAGAVYLVYLGVQALRNGRLRPQPGALSAEPSWETFRAGFLVALLNPKTAIFFAAFLPQFMTAGAPMLQSLALGAVFVMMAAGTDTLYVCAASSLRPLLGGRIAAAGRYLGGGTFIALGLLAAAGGSRSLRP